MSNRTESQVTYAAELKAAHVAQIEALTAPGLTDDERIERFMDAARFGEDHRAFTNDERQHSRVNRYVISVACLLWREGGAPFSLFADMPDCECPVREVMKGEKIAGIPPCITFGWSPTADDLQAFARIQQERRL